MEAGYVFLKTHKTASLSVYHMLNAVLATTHGVRQCDPRHEHSATAVPNPPVVLNPPVVPNPSIGCRSCLSHDSLRPVALAVRAPRVVGAHCVAQQVCPFWVPNRHVYTLIVLRNPIDRAESRYHYERAQGWCRKHAAAHGADAGCASDHLAFDAWCLLSDEVMSRRRLFRVSQDQLLAETTWLLGGKRRGAGATRAGSHRRRRRYRAPSRDATRARGAVALAGARAPRTTRSLPPARRATSRAQRQSPPLAPQSERLVAARNTAPRTGKCAADACAGLDGATSRPCGANLWRLRRRASGQWGPHRARLPRPRRHTHRC